MKSKVYFTPVDSADNIQDINVKTKNLLKKSRLFDFIQKKDKTALKMHFGEEGNTGFVRPEHAGVICREILDRGAEVFLSDANTLYRGRRLEAGEHLALAKEHGFVKEITGVDVIIPDDHDAQASVEVAIGQKFIKAAKVARVFIEADAIVALSHFKGHILTGFGGAVKNIGMGCATREGKLAQHCDVSPVVYSNKCIGCAECRKVCPAGAIRIENKKSVIDKAKCIGCASCMAACSTMAMFIDFAAGEKTQDKIAEYCWAVLRGKKAKAAFINFAVKINKECDCWGAENPRIAPDVGILASRDPVSIDKASFDLVNKACEKDIFKATHPDSNGMKQLEYAQEIGLGSLDYDLVAV
ncbi:MAG: DUF362 domain-containing protein [Candidatus Omnitrophota bacterium]